MLRITFKELLVGKCQKALNIFMNVTEMFQSLYELYINLKKTAKEIVG